MGVRGQNSRRNTEMAGETPNTTATSIDEKKSRRAEKLVVAEVGSPRRVPDLVKVTRTDGLKVGFAAELGGAIVVRSPVEIVLDRDFTDGRFDLGMSFDRAVVVQLTPDWAGHLSLCEHGRQVGSVLVPAGTSLWAHLAIRPNPPNTLSRVEVPDKTAFLYAFPLARVDGVDQG